MLERFFGKNMDKCWAQGLHPFTSKGAPKEFVCAECLGNGWGPMLRTYVWKCITRTHEEFLCEPCMVKRLKRPLEITDLRIVPMNFKHPLFAHLEIVSRIGD